MTGVLPLLSFGHVIFVAAAAGADVYAQASAVRKDSVRGRCVRGPPASSGRAPLIMNEPRFVSRHNELCCHVLTAGVSAISSSEKPIDCCHLAWSACMAGGRPDRSRVVPLAIVA